MKRRSFHLTSLSRKTACNVCFKQFITTTSETQNKNINAQITLVATPPTPIKMIFKGV